MSEGDLSLANAAGTLVSDGKELLFEESSPQSPFFSGIDIIDDTILYIVFEGI